MQELTPEQFTGLGTNTDAGGLSPSQFNALGTAASAPPASTPPPPVPTHPNLDSMYAAAPQAKEHIDELAEEIAKEHEAHGVAKAPIKGRKRAEEKIKTDYQGNHNKITDLVRNTIIVKHHEDIPKILETAKKHGAVQVKHVKEHENALGYNGGQAKFMTPQGIYGEVQANTAHMIVAKEGEENARKMLGDKHYEKVAKEFDKEGIERGLGHKLYEIARSSKTSADERRQIEIKSFAYYTKVYRIEKREGYVDKKEDKDYNDKKGIKVRIK